jgi:integrase
MKKSITLTQECDGLVRYKSATGMSPNTIRNYRTTFAKLQAYFDSHPERSYIPSTGSGQALSGGLQAAVEGAAETSASSVEPSKDPAFDAITRDQLIDFFAWLRDEYLSEPDGAAPRGQIKLAPKTILNIHTDLSALLSWGVEEGFVPVNIVRTIDPPDPKTPVVETLTKEEIDALLTACDRSKTWKNWQVVANERPTADRDCAIILLLLDTGLRASELCGIKFGDINLTTNSIKVLGKGQKDRSTNYYKRYSNRVFARDSHRC